MSEPILKISNLCAVVAEDGTEILRGVDLELKPGEIQLHVRNEGADPVRVRQVIVNDGYAAFTQTDNEIGRLGGSEIDVTYPWIEGQDYEVVMLTETGATIDHAITAATETPGADVDFYALMALIGLYVGVIPVAIGMLWLPWVRGVDPRWIQFLSELPKTATGKIQRFKLR